MSEFFEVASGVALCCNPGGKWHGWLFRRGNNNNWVSVRKLEQLEFPTEGVFLRTPMSGALVGQLRANAMAIAPNPNDPSDCVEWQAADCIEELELALRRAMKAK